MEGDTTDDNTTCLCCHYETTNGVATSNLTNENAASNLANEIAADIENSKNIGDFVFNVGIVVFQMVAFSFILIPRRMKASLRIILMSLTIPGFLQNLTWTLIRLWTMWFRPPLTGSEPGCKFLIFMTLMGTLCSQSAIAGVTLNNYLAVFHPVVFRRWVTPLKTLVFMTSLWCFWAVVDVIEVTTGLDSEPVCYPLVVCSLYILSIMAAVILITTIVVGFLNFKLVNKLWGKVKVHPLNPDVKTSLNPNETKTNFLRAASTVPETAPGKSIFCISEDSKISPSLRERPQIATTKNEHVLDTEHSRRTISEMYLQIRAKNSGKISNPDISSIQDGVKVEVSQLDSRSQHQSSRFNGHHLRRQSRDRSLAVTLIILTVWNTLGYLPYMGCLVQSVAYRDIAGSSASLTTVSDMSGIVIRLSIIGNTLIYAWTFAQWRSVCARCFMCR